MALNYSAFTKVDNNEKNSSLDYSAFGIKNEEPFVSTESTSSKFVFGGEKKAPDTLEFGSQEARDSMVKDYKPLAKYGLKVNIGGFIDSLKSFDEKDIPFFGSGKEAIEDIGVVKSFNRFKKGTATAEDKEKLDTYYKETEEESRKRENIGYAAGEVIKGSIRFMGELFPSILAEIATGGIAPTGDAMILKGAVKLGAKNVTKKMLTDKAYQKTLTTAVKNIAKKEAKLLASQFVISAPTNITLGAAQRQIGIVDLETGEVLQDGQDIGESIVNAITGHAVELITERGGGFITKNVVKGLSTPVRKVITKTAIFNSLKNKLAGATNQQIVNILNKTGWNGVIGEWFEERDADVLNHALATVGLGDQKFTGLTMDQVATELLAFSVMGTGASILSNKNVGDTLKQINKGKRGFVKIPFMKDGKKSLDEIFTKGQTTLLEDNDVDYLLTLDKSGNLSETNQQVLIEKVKTEESATELREQYLDNLAVVMGEIRDRELDMEMPTNKQTADKEIIGNKIKAIDKLLESKNLSKDSVVPLVGNLTNNGKEVAGYLKEDLEESDSYKYFDEKIFEEIKKEDYISETISIEKLRLLDPKLDKYLSQDKDDLFGDDNVDTSPIVSSDGKVITGYNTIKGAASMRQYKDVDEDFEEDIDIYRGSKYSKKELDKVYNAYQQKEYDKEQAKAKPLTEEDYEEDVYDDEIEPDLTSIDDKTELEIPDRIKEIASMSQKESTEFDREQFFMEELKKEYGDFYKDYKINYKMLGIEDEFTKDFIENSWEDLYTYSINPKIKLTDEFTKDYLFNSAESKPEVKVEKPITEAEKKKTSAKPVDNLEVEKKVEPKVETKKEPKATKDEINLIEEAKKFKTADEFIEAQPIKKSKLSNAMDHRPSFEEMPPAHNLLKNETLPKDVYTHPDYSIGNGAIRRGEKSANESWNVLQKIKNKPNAKIIIYRASPKNELRNGDWVTFSKEYARLSSLEEGVAVNSFKVKAKDVIFAGDDINEFGYWGHSIKEITRLTEIWNKAKKVEVKEKVKPKAETKEETVSSSKEKTETKENKKTESKYKKKTYSPEEMANRRYTKEARKYFTVEEFIKSEGTLLKTKQELTAIWKKATRDTAFQKEVKRFNGETLSDFVRRRRATLLKYRIKALAKGIRQGRLEKRREIFAVQKEVENIIMKSGLNGDDKAKFIRVIKYANSAKRLKIIVPIIEERISRLAEASAERSLVAKMRKTLKATPAKGAKPKGKYTAETQEVLDALYRIVKLNQTSAESLLGSNLDSNPNGVSHEIKVENYLLSLFIGNSTKKAKLLNIIEEVKFKGSVNAEVKRNNREEVISREAGYTFDQITGDKGLNKGRERGESIKKTKQEKFKQFFKGIGTHIMLDWQGLLIASEQNSSVKNLSLSKVFSVTKNESAYKASMTNFSEDFDNAIVSIYNIENKSNKKHKKLIDLSTEILDIDGREMTRDELIKVYMEIQDPSLYESFILGNEFTDKTFDAIEKAMTKEDKAFAKWQLDYYRKLYDRVNEVYKEMNGVNLPFNEFYSPIKRVGYVKKEGHTGFIDELFYNVTASNRALNSRTKNVLPIEQQGSLSALERNIIDMNYYIAWAEKIRELEAVFNTIEVREAYKQEFPPNVYKAVKNKIKHMAEHGNRNAENVKIIDTFRKNYIFGNLAIKPVLMVKQLISTIAYAEKISPVALAIGIVDFFKHPIKNYNILKNESAFIKARGAGIELKIQGVINEGLISKSGRINSLTRNLLLNVFVGDKAAIVIGSWAMRKKRLSEGKKIEDIIEEYEDFGSETQQSAEVSRLSEIQLGGSVAKLFTLFKSSQRAMFQKEVNAIRSLFRKGGLEKDNLKKVSKIMFIYHFMIPMLFQIAANMGGDDDDDIKEYKVAAILGSFNGWLVAGDVMQNVIRMAFGLRTWETGGIFLTDIADDIISGISKLNEKDVTHQDFLDALDYFAGASSSIAGLPIEYAYDFGESISKKDYDTAFLQALGWSEYAIEPRDNKKSKTPSSLNSKRTLDDILGSKKGGVSSSRRSLDDILKSKK